MSILFSGTAFLMALIFLATTSLTLLAKSKGPGAIAYLIAKAIIGYFYGVLVFNIWFVDHNPSAFISWMMLPLALFMIGEGFANNSGYLFSGIIILLIFLGVSWFYPMTLASKEKAVAGGIVTEKLMVETDQKHLPVVGQEYATYIAERKMSSWKQNISYFELGKGRKQSIHGTLYYVFPLEYRGFFKWTKGQDIPGFIMVNAEQPNSQDAKFVQSPMKYTPSAYFGDNLNRIVRNQNPKLILMDPTFQVDDQEKPYYVIPYGHYAAYRNIRTVDGAILVDPKTGKQTKYALKDVPKFVDQIIPTDVAEERMQWFGDYRNGGYVNANGILGIGASQTGVVQPTNWGEDDGVVGLFDNHLSLTWFTDFTNPTGNSHSMVGYAMMNARTGKLTYYDNSNGLSGTDAKNISSKGTLKSQSLSGNVQGLYTIFGTPTWLVSLNDSSGVYRYTAFVDAQNEQIYAYDKDKGQALTLYQTALANGALSDSSQATKEKEIKEAVGQIISVYKKEDGNGTAVSFLLKGRPEIFTITTAGYPYTPFIDKNQQVDVQYYDTKQINVSVDSMQDTAIDNMIKQPIKK